MVSAGCTDALDSAASGCAVISSAPETAASSAAETAVSGSAMLFLISVSIIRLLLFRYSPMPPPIFHAVFPAMQAVRQLVYRLFYHAYGEKYNSFRFFCRYYFFNHRRCRSYFVRRPDYICGDGFRQQSRDVVRISFHQFSAMPLLFIHWVLTLIIVSVSSQSEIRSCHWRRLPSYVFRQAGHWLGRLPPLSWIP